MQNVMIEREENGCGERNESLGAGIKKRGGGKKEKIATKTWGKFLTIVRGMIGMHNIYPCNATVVKYIC